jgi:hypothetical protein
MIRTSSLIAVPRERTECQHWRIGFAEHLDNDSEFLEKGLNLGIRGQTLCRYKGMCQLVLGYPAINSLNIQICCTSGP